MNALKFTAAKRQLSLLALAGLATLGSTTVSAQQVVGPYIGANLGATRSDFNNGDVNRYLLNRGFTVNSSSEDNSSTGGKLFGGYQFTPYFAVEGGYFDLGKFDYRANTTPAGSFGVNNRIRGLNLDLVGTAPLTDKFSVFGRIGAAYAQNRANFASTGLVPAYTGSTRTNDTNLKLGIGVQYAITEALALRAELERYRINDPIRNRGHVDMASVGLVYRFGPKAQTPVAYVAPAPVYVAPPAPVVVAPPPAPAPVVAPAPVYVEPARPAKQGRN
ncbi:MAG TPA: outer membrane beta-barrel protein [Polaromonas sp.]|uniref:outer membrane beta-barrel protein n=1 Tax=Polaromonas sp. TaxID=1869339 RepID=UPI002D57B345|nr:outer membrane beta-barrel protein [Polaromonas sp.]HYW58486.1 outer membrane beta-barrel protein [Polaromonas sp.]